MKDFRSLFAGSPVAPYLTSCEEILPSFLYDGTDISGWEPDPVQEKREDSRILRRVSFVSPDGRLTYTLNLILYSDFPAAEWLPELENTADVPTGRISGFRSLVFSAKIPDVPKSGFSTVTLQRNLGSRARHDDFADADLTLHTHSGQRVEMVSSMGKSSSDWMPYFGLRLNPRGFFFHFGIGWSGAWRAAFRLDGTTLTAETGLLKTDFFLNPGEKVRQPSMFLLAHEPGTDPDEAQNITRRFMLENHSPKDSRGGIIPAPVCYNVGGGIPRRMLLDILECIRREKLGYDVLWMDAGWFGPDRPEEQPAFHREGDVADDTLGKWTAGRGNWRVNRGHHIHGLAEYADTAKSIGMKFLLWFEIETSVYGTPAAEQHPEWFLPLDCGALLLNLGNPDALEYAKEVFRNRIREEHIGMIRIDFNVNSLSAWFRNDPPGRTGITETKYIMGLYELWDAIREILPDQAIDNCASGGRRLDFELLSRSIPLWRTDGLQTSESNQAHTALLSRWVPQHAGGIYGDPLPAGDDYAQLSRIMTGALISYYPDQIEKDPEWVRRLVRTTRRLSPLSRQNLWNITPCSPDDKTVPHIRQCDSYDHSEGYFIVFRRELCPVAEFTVPLRHIDPDADYELDDGKGEIRRISGKELGKIRVTLPEPHSVQLRFYRKAGPNV